MTVVFLKMTVVSSRRAIVCVFDNKYLAIFNGTLVFLTFEQTDYGAKSIVQVNSQVHVL